MQVLPRRSTIRRPGRAGAVRSAPARFRRPAPAGPGADRCRPPPPARPRHVLEPRQDLARGGGRAEQDRRAGAGPGGRVRRRPGLAGPRRRGRRAGRRAVGGAARRTDQAAGPLGAEVGRAARRGGASAQPVPAARVRGMGEHVAAVGRLPLLDVLDRVRPAPAGRGRLGSQGRRAARRAAAGRQAAGRAGAARRRHRPLDLDADRLAALLHDSGCPAVLPSSPTGVHDRMRPARAGAARRPRLVPDHRRGPGRLGGGQRLGDLAGHGQGRCCSGAARRSLDARARRWSTRSSRPRSWR